MISVKQIQALRRDVKAAGISRVEVLCVEALGFVHAPGPIAPDSPSVKVVAREFVSRAATKLGHNMARQNNSCECSRCGRTGAVSNLGERGLKLDGAIFTERCQ